jgi:hypothetical protein
MSSVKEDGTSIISFAIARAIKEQPEMAGVEMLKLIQENARLEAEVAMLRARAAELEMWIGSGYGRSRAASRSV